MNINSNHRRLRFAQPWIAAILVLFCCAESLTAQAVTSAYRRQITSADLMIAVAEGFFEDEGLDLEARSWNGSTETLPMLSKGALSFVVTGVMSPAYINVIDRGARIRLVRARSILPAEGCSYRAFVARNELLDSGRLTDPASLRGLRVALDPTAGSYYPWMMLLRAGGLTRADVRPQRLPQEAKQAALERGLIDVVEIGEPRIQQAVDAGIGRPWLPVGHLLPDRQSTFLLFGSDLLDERPDVGRRVVRALDRGIDQYLDPNQRTRNAQIIAEASGLPLDQIEKMCWPGWSRDGSIDIEQLDHLQEWAIAEGILDRRVPASNLIDTRFLRSNP